MSLEYRFFVVDHQIVSGAPVCREHTVLDRLSSGRGGKPSRLDPRSCTRATGGTVTVDRQRIANYARAARRLIAEIKREDRAMKDFVLDYADFGDGRFGPIEINTIANAGLYANDPTRIMPALAKQARSGMIRDYSHRFDADDQAVDGATDDA